MPNPGSTTTKTTDPTVSQKNNKGNKKNKKEENKEKKRGSLPSTFPGFQEKEVDSNASLGRSGDSEDIVQMKQYQQALDEIRGTEEETDPVDDFQQKAQARLHRMTQAVGTDRIPVLNDKSLQEGEEKREFSEAMQFDNDEQQTEEDFDHLVEPNRVKMKRKVAEGVHKVKEAARVGKRKVAQATAGSDHFSHTPEDLLKQDDVRRRAEDVQYQQTELEAKDPSF